MSTTGKQIFEMQITYIAIRPCRQLTITKPVKSNIIESIIKTQ